MRWKSVRKYLKSNWPTLVSVLIALLCVIYVIISFQLNLNDGERCATYRDFISYLDDIGIVTGIISTFITLWVFAYTRRILGKDTIPYQEVTTDKDSAVIVIDVGNLECKNDVSKYVWKDERLKEAIVCSEKEDLKNCVQYINTREAAGRDNIFKFEYGISTSIPDAESFDGRGRMITLSSGAISDDKKKFQNAVDDLYDALSDLRRELSRDTVKHIYLFYGGLAIFPFFIGEFFSNSIKVDIFHYNNGEYIYAGVMDKNSRGHDSNSNYSKRNYSKRNYLFRLL